MIISTRISADLQTPGYPPLVHAVQGEQYSRLLKMALYDGGVAWTVPGGVFVAMRYSKPDGTTGYYDTLPDGTQAWSAEGNTVSIYVAPQMLTVPGVVQGQLEIILNQSILASFPLRLKVAANVAATLQESKDYVNWLEWMEDQLAQRLIDAAESGEFQGEPGYTPVKGVDYYTPEEIAQIKTEVTPVKGVDYFDGAPGADAVLILNEVTYQAGESGETLPTGTWQETIPAVPKGFYLWTRRILQWNTGDPVTDYSVAYQGLDGSGTVNTVCGKIPDDAGNVTLVPADVGVDTVSVSATLTAAGWVGGSAPYTQTIQVAGLTDGKRARAYPVYGDDTDANLALKEACGMVSFASRSGSSMTFTCLEEKPSVDIPVTVEVYV